MAFRKGQSGNPAGRAKGSRNRVPAEARNNVVQVFEELGGVEAMVDWAKENQTEFYRFYSRLLPKQVDLDALVENEDQPVTKEEIVAHGAALGLDEKTIFGC